jgi:hypothetical protein
MKERYQDMKIDFLKTIHLLREKLYHQQKSDSVTMENKEDKTKKQASSSKSTSPTKQVCKVKINSTSNSAQSEAPLDPFEVP